MKRVEVMRRVSSEVVRKGWAAGGGGGRGRVADLVDLVVLIPVYYYSVARWEVAALTQKKSGLRI